MKTINPIEFGIKKNRTISEGAKFDLVQFGSDSVNEFLDFYFNRRVDFARKIRPGCVISAEQLKQFKEKDISYFSNSIFLSIIHKESGNLVATLKALKKNEFIKIKTEYAYNIDLPEFCKTINIDSNDIWHYSRLTVDSEFLKQKSFSYDVNLDISVLLYYSIFQFAKNEFDVVFAEVSEESFPYFITKLKHNWKRFTGTLESMGLQVFAVYMTKKDFQDWCYNVDNTFSLL